MNKGICARIDDSRLRSGGERAHLIEILSHTALAMYGIDCIHLWTNQVFLGSL